MLEIARWRFEQVDRWRIQCQWILNSIQFLCTTVDINNFLGEIQCVALSPIAILGVCPCVGMFVGTLRWWTTRKRFETYPPNFHHIVDHKEPLYYTFDDVVSHDRNLLFEGQRFEIGTILLINRDYLANGNKGQQTLLLPKHRRSPIAFDWPWPVLKVKVCRAASRWSTDRRHH